MFGLGMQYGRLSLRVEIATIPCASFNRNDQLGQQDKCSLLDAAIMMVQGLF